MRSDCKNCEHCGGYQKSFYLNIQHSNSGSTNDASLGRGYLYWRANDREESVMETRSALIYIICSFTFSLHVPEKLLNIIASIL